MEQIIQITKELNQLVSSISYETKTRILKDNPKLKYVLFDEPAYFHSIVYDINQFEKKFDTKVSKTLKQALEIVGSKGYSFLDLFNYHVSSYYPVDTFFSEKFVKILIQNDVDEAEIQDAYYDKETKTFSSEKIAKVYFSQSQKENLLIDYVSFDECCGGRNLLILNGPDENIIAYDNHGSYREIEHNGKVYNYQTYLYLSEDETIFKMILSEINDNIIKLKTYI